MWFAEIWLTLVLFLKETGAVFLWTDTSIPVFRRGTEAEHEVLYILPVTSVELKIHHYYNFI